MLIPKIIHQTWKTTTIPRRFQGYVQSWKDLNPGWEYRLWTDVDCRNLIESHYGWFLSQYDSYPKNIQRADAARYFILHHCGGIYADLDFECLKPFSKVLEDRPDFFIGQEPRIHADRLYDREGLVCNAIMGSVSQHALWEVVFDQLEKNYSLSNVIFQTGPGLVQDAMDRYQRQDLMVYPENVFYPLVCVDNSALKLSPSEIDYYKEMTRDKAYPMESLAVHHWAGTWYKRRGLLKKLLGWRKNTA